MLVSGWGVVVGDVVAENAWADGTAEAARRREVAEKNFIVSL